MFPGVLVDSTLPLVLHRRVSLMCVSLWDSILNSKVSNPDCLQLLSLQAPSFMNESCHSPYNNTAYYSEGVSGTHSFDTGSTHHSLILEYPTTGSSQLLEDSKERGRTSYSCEQNIQVGSSCIQLLVKEATSIFPGAVDFSGAHINGDHMAGNEDKGMDDSMGGVQVRIQCADEDIDTVKLSEIHRLGHDLLQPTVQTGTSPTSSNSSEDSIGSPTPTPSYGGLTSSTALEYPGSENKAFAVRGGEVAQLEEELNGEKGI